MKNFTIKSKIARKPISNDEVNLYIPEKCCVYEDEKLI